MRDYRLKKKLKKQAKLAEEEEEEEEEESVKYKLTSSDSETEPDHFLSVLTKRPAYKFKFCTDDDIHQLKKR